MRSLRLHGPGDLRLQDEAPPIPGPGEELVRVDAVGICGSDLHWYAESAIGDAVLTRPLVLGHEAGGAIASGPRRGQRVAIDPAIPCEACEQCHAGHGHLCLALRFAGHGATDGALREFAAWPGRCLVPVPDSLSDADVAMLEPLGVALHAVRLAHIRPGARVGVFAAALAAGGSERAELLAATDGHGVDVAFEAAGEDDAVETSIALAAPAGTVVVVGIPATDHMSFTASTARRKGLTIKLSRRMNRVYPDVVRLVEAGLVDVRSVVTASYPLTEFKAAFDAASARVGLKVMVRPSE